MGRSNNAQSDRMYVAKGLLTDFEKKGVILTLREVWSPVWRTYEHS
jgi:hypothetical protein